MVGLKLEALFLSQPLERWDYRQAGNPTAPCMPSVTDNGGGAGGPQQLRTCTVFAETLGSILVAFLLVKYRTVVP